MQVGVHMRIPNGTERTHSCKLIILLAKLNFNACMRERERDTVDPRIKIRSIQWLNKLAKNWFNDQKVFIVGIKNVCLNLERMKNVEIYELKCGNKEAKRSALRRERARGIGSMCANWPCVGGWMLLLLQRTDLSIQRNTSGSLVTRRDLISVAVLSLAEHRRPIVLSALCFSRTHFSKDFRVDFNSNHVIDSLSLSMKILLLVWLKEIKWCKV